MTRSLLHRVGISCALALVGLLSYGALTASAKPILMKTLTGEVAYQLGIDKQHVKDSSLQPPPPPCPENGMLPSPFSNCGLPELPATTLPFPGNMAYWGGPVQAHKHEYLVLWGWGEKGAFPATDTCKAEKLTEGSITTTLACDPDGAGKRMADWVYQLGGTQWAGVQDQYYQNTSSGKQFITNAKDVLSGIWVDDTNSITGLPKTSSTNPAGPTNTYTDLAAEAARAVAHFHVTDLTDANLIIAQPPNYSDPNALSAGYCAFHDYTLPGVESGIYNGIKAGIPYTNMPYALAINSGGANVCGENAVNSGTAGKLDGYSIVLGHEIMETVTDPGAEDITGGSGVNNQTYYGGWYDPLDANENGDKCAWVGEPLVGGAPGEPNVEPVPGAMGDITGNHGTKFAVQSLWSNDSAGGAGYCAGAGTDLPTG